MPLKFGWNSLNFINVFFAILVSSSLWKRAWPFILNSFSLRMLCANFGRIFSSVLLEKIFYFFQCILAIYLLSLFGKGCGLEQTWIPLIQGSFVPILVEIGLVGKRIFKFGQCISLLSPLEKEHVLHLKKFESPLLKDAFCHVWLKLVQWLCRKVKKTNGWSSHELSALVR